MFVGYLERITDLPATARHCLCAVDTSGKTSSTAQRQPSKEDRKHILLLFIIIIILAHWYFIPRGVKTKQIGDISEMVTLRTRKLKMSWPGILS